MRRVMGRVMRRLLLLALLAAAPGTAAAQSSQFGIRGLGLPGRAQSARALGSAGGFALFDGESSVSPATLAYLNQLTAAFTVMGDYRSSVTPSGEGSVRDTRFPQFQVAGPVRPLPLVVGVSYSTYTNRDFSLAFPGTVQIRDTAVGVNDTITSRGGLNDFRIAAAYRLARRWVVGVGGHIITGTNRIEVHRSFSDTLYQASLQRAELSYAGFGVSLGVLGQIGSTVTLSALARTDGHVDVEVDSLAAHSIDLPLTVGGGLQWRPSPKLSVAGQVLARNWSTANDDLVAAGGVGAVNTLEAAGGLEFTPNPRRPLRAPIRLGFRYSRLPFPLAAGAPAREYGLAAGSGFSFAADRGGVDLAVERAWRRQDDGFTERAWIVTLGLTVRP